MATVNRKWNDGMLSNEDWWAVWLGLIIFLAGMMSIWGLDLVGWMSKTKTCRIHHTDLHWCLVPETRRQEILHQLYDHLHSHLVMLDYRP
jgi:hypothetical protein